jgi:hypothetical protein
VAEPQGGAGFPHLKSFQANAFPDAALVHLNPFTSLTSMRLQAISYSSGMTGTEVCAALAGLTSLRCLAINTCADDLLPGTSSLTNLTSLYVKRVTCWEGVSNMRYLPPQLQELTMPIHLFGGMQPPVDLSHITGLTRLMAAAVDPNGCDGWAVWTAVWPVR